MSSSLHFNNLIEQDHRCIKCRINVMPGFEHFGNAAITLSGIESMHRIRNGQFNVATLGLKEAIAPTVWTAVLSV
nr:transposase [Paraburkholderia sp. HP33-1]